MHCVCPSPSPSPSLPLVSVPTCLSVSWGAKSALSVTLVNIPILWTMFTSLWDTLRGKCLLSVYALVWHDQSTDLLYVLNQSRYNTVYCVGCGNTHGWGISVYLYSKSNYCLGISMRANLCCKQGMFMCGKKCVHSLPGSKRRQGDFTWMWLCVCLVRQ